MQVESIIRKLARSTYYQQLFHSSKNCNGIYLFENQTNFSGIQSLFLYWLETYSLLFKELSQLEWENLDEKVLKDDYRTDCFLYWRSKFIEKEIRKAKKEEKKAKKKPGTLGLPIFKGIQNKEGTD
jgi:hypothetical protein